MKATRQHAEADQSHVDACFDLEKVLSTPHREGMFIGFSQKYPCYNFTVYKNVTKNEYCFFWEQKNGNQGSNKIATCPLWWVKEVDCRGTVKTVSLSCDCCSGQNRNCQMLAMLFLTLQQCKSIQIIELNFLLLVHSLMTIDSMHSVTENDVRGITVYAPMDDSAPNCKEKSSSIYC